MQKDLKDLGALRVSRERARKFDALTRDIAAAGLAFGLFFLLLLALFVYIGE